MVTTEEATTESQLHGSQFAKMFAWESRLERHHVGEVLLCMLKLRGVFVQVRVGPLWIPFMDNIQTLLQKIGMFWEKGIFLHDKCSIEICTPD